MPEHYFHQTVGNLIEGLGLTPHKQVWLDLACGGEEVVPLSNGTGSKAVRFCFVDILIILHRKIVVIEIEESDVKPLHLFGKFYASAFSTHFKDRHISNLPLLFIQVLDTSKVNLEKGEKGKQWDRIEKILEGQTETWQGRKVEYRLLSGREAEFDTGKKKGQELLRTIYRFLGNLRVI